LARIELHTEVEEVIPAEDVPGFRVKKIDLGGIELETPVRPLYTGTDIPSHIRKEILSLKDKKRTLLEVNRTIYRDISYSSLERALERGEGVKEHFKANEDLARENLAIVLSFSRFPDIALGNSFEELLDYLHAYSRVVFVPHVRFSSKNAKTSLRYSAPEFIKYVEKSLKILGERNAKSLFVPLDINFDKKTRNEVILHYAKNGYTNIWIDLKGQAINSSQIAKLRGTLRAIERAFGRESQQVVIYIANAKKVPRGLTMDVKLTPSDVLGPFVYGDIVGSPWKGIVGFSQEDAESYWEKKGFSSEEEYNLALFKRDASILDTGTYYYWHPDIVRISDSSLEKLREDMLSLGPNNRSKAEKVSNAINGTIHLRELGIIKKHVESEGFIASYLSEKGFFKETDEGRGLLQKIAFTSNRGTPERKTKSLFDFMKR